MNTSDRSPTPSRSSSIAICLCFGFGCLFLLSPAMVMAEDPAGAAAPRVDFARHVLPVLSEKCFVCHGPDTKQEDLPRLDSYAGATRDLGGYRAIDPESPESSELLARINDPDNPMPPADAEKPLTEAERELLSRWVRQGGSYAKHWAFVPPRRAPVPETAGGPNRNPIDAFVGAGLRERGVDFAPEADRATLARRVALVLTGLPPEPEQLERFMNDRSADAYERLVDRLLESPRFGEHQARYWLDAVRYGDTHGLHLDNRRGIYPFRDWVVFAFNENLPLDDFITWQLAGDLLPDPTVAQLVATGFVRMNPTTAEGGALPEEFQCKNNFDRTETLGTVLLGMSLTCARCHTHKYDPIPQTEYYRLLAFFNSTAENAMDGNAYEYGPVVEAPRDQSGWRQWSRLEAKRDRLLNDADRTARSRAAELIQYARARQDWSADDWRITEPVPVSADRPEEDDWTEADGLPGAMKRKLPTEKEAVWVSLAVDVPEDQFLWLSFSGGPGSRVLVDERSVEPTESVKPTKSAASESLVRSRPLSLARGRHVVRVKMTGTATDRSAAISVRVENPWDVLSSRESWDACEKDERLRMLADPNGPLAEESTRESAIELEERIAAARAEFTTSLVARDLPQSRPTRVLRRGEYDKPEGEPLEPGILEVMGAFPADAPRNRLGLAQWLTSPDHPLVSRVLTNRIWQRTFGHGLVRTPEDFGLQGRQPTHPELLDWLSVELRESGWDLKHLLRLMVRSRTFRQGSAWRADLDDPDNLLLGRGPGYRMDAEVIRDVALWAAGLLDPRMGGEGVKPYQPDGMWLAMAHPASNTKRYVRDKGAKLYRRSLYVYWKRTSPHPMMTLFDAPSRESSCVRRSRTSTSLQSLGLLNETQRLEMAKVLAQRLLLEAGDDDQRLDMLFRLLACRSASDVERSACSKLLRAMKSRYESAERDALSLLAAAGDAPRDETLSPAEHAAWTQVAVTVLASDVALLLY